MWRNSLARNWFAASEVETKGDCMRVTFTHPAELQPQGAYKRADDAKSGKPLPHMIVSIDGFVVKRARDGSMYEAPATLQLDTSRFLVVVADESYPHGRCRIHAEGWPSPLIVDRTANFVLLELGFDPTFILNSPPPNLDTFII